MEQATNAANAGGVDVRSLTARQTDLQTEYIKNENRVNAAKGRKLHGLSLVLASGQII